MRNFKDRIRRLEEAIERVKAAREEGKNWPEDPVEFCQKFLGFEPTAYQEKLLRDRTQFIVGRWARQSSPTA